MNSSALISKCGQYRYRLERRIGDGPTVLGIMINPSWADALHNDRTILRWIGFAERNGWGRIVIGNKFAFRSQFPRDMNQCSDPIGPENDFHLRNMFAEADLCIAAWGPIAKIPRSSLRGRWISVHRMAQEADKKFHCWGVAKDGHPLHPLMLPYSSRLMPWRAPTGER